LIKNISVNAMRTDNQNLVKNG